YNRIGVLARRTARLTTSILTGICALIAVACGSKPSNPGTNPTPNPPPQTAAWADEFDGPANSAPDPTKWTYDLGAGGWGNQELRSYTTYPDHERLACQGQLTIR